MSRDAPPNGQIPAEVVAKRLGLVSRRIHPPAAPGAKPWAEADYLMFSACHPRESAMALSLASCMGARPKAFVHSAGTFYVPAWPAGASKAPAERTKAFGLFAPQPPMQHPRSARVLHRHLLPLGEGHGLAPVGRSDSGRHGLSFGECGLT